MSQGGARIYSVNVIRIGYGYKTLTVAADTPEEAKEKALGEAGSFEYSEKTSDYEVDGGAYPAEPYEYAYGVDIP